MANVILTAIPSTSTAQFGVTKTHTGSNAAPTGELQTVTAPKPRRKKRPPKVKRANVAKRSTAVPAGVWGAEGIVFTVASDGVTIQYDCAEGFIEHPIKIDEHGYFNELGIHSPRHGGPTIMNETPVRLGTRFEGKITGDTMSLKVILIGTSEVIGNFTLERGKTPRMHQCG